MISFCSDLFFAGYNIINQHYQKQIHFLSMILLNLFNNFVKKIPRVHNDFIMVSLPIITYVITFCVQEEIKLIDIVD